MATELAYRVQPGDRVDLRVLKPADSKGNDKEQADAQFVTLNAELTRLQELQYAAGQSGILIVLQGLDTAGKDGTIRHVMANFNPASCRVESFKAPTPDERTHDFLWRIHRATPPLGSITIFNRSHYEDVLVTLVHKLVPEKTIANRYRHINEFEKLLVDSGTIVLKFFLFISKDEQKKRLLARENDSGKAWKLSESDWPEHALYDDYLRAYERALHECSTDVAPWFIVPSDKKWFRNLAVATTIVNAMQAVEHDWKRALKARGDAQLAMRAKQRLQQTGGSGPP